MSRQLADKFWALEGISPENRAFLLRVPKSEEAIVEAELKAAPNPVAHLQALTIKRTMVKSQAEPPKPASTTTTSRNSGQASAPRTQQATATVQAQTKVAQPAAEPQSGRLAQVADAFKAGGSAVKNFVSGIKLPSIDWKPEVDLSWMGKPLSYVLMHFGWVLILFIMVPIGMQAFAPEFMNSLDFADVSGGPAVRGAMTWKVTAYWDANYYNLFIANVGTISAVVQFLTVLVVLAQISAIADALSGLTGSDLTGAMGHLIVLLAFGMPTTLLKMLVVLVGCWAMNRIGDTRRASQHWILLAGFTAMATFLIGDNYLLLSTNGAAGMLRAAIHFLFNLGLNQAFVPVHVVIAVFTFQAFRFSRDGSSQAALHFLLAWITLVTGQVPFSVGVTGQHEYLSVTSINPYALYWTTNLLIALGLSVKEMIKFATQDQNKQTIYIKTFIRPMANLAIYAVTGFVAWLLFAYAKWDFVWALLVGYQVPMLVLGTLHYGMSATNPQMKQMVVTMFNQILGDHTVMWFYMILNDNFNVMLVFIAFFTLSFRSVAVALGVGG